MAESLLDWLYADIRNSLKPADKVVADRLVNELREAIDSLGNTIDIDELEIRLIAIGKEIDRQIAKANSLQGREAN